MHLKRPSAAQQTRKASMEALASLAKTLQKDRDTLGVLRQVTAQLKQEHALLVSVLKYLPCGVAIASAPSGLLIISNDVMEKVFDQPFEHSRDMLDPKQWKIFHPNGTPYEHADWPMARAILYGEIVSGEISKIERADRSYSYVVVSAAPLPDHRGQTIAGMLTVTEIARPSFGLHAGNRRKRLIERNKQAA